MYNQFNKDLLEFNVLENREFLFKYVYNFIDHKMGVSFTVLEINIS